MVGVEKTRIFMEAIESAGKLIVKDRCPYIYFIIKGEVLYIGETQRDPLSRWGEHFGEKGTFRKALLRADEELYSTALYTEFYAYRCELIEKDLKEIERRQATRHVENQIHLKILSSGTTLRVVSDTIRTAPIHNKYNWLNDYANELCVIFFNDLKNKKI